jgi:hypothetical protein
MAELQNLDRIHVRGYGPCGAAMCKSSHGQIEPYMAARESRGGRVILSAPAPIGSPGRYRISRYGVLCQGRDMIELLGYTGSQPRVVLISAGIGFHHRLPIRLARGGLVCS